MKTVGKYLYEYRVKAQLSIEELAAATKIRVDFLSLLEQDRFDQLPSATFVKGFIRSYALSVGADPSKALAIFRRDFDADKSGRVVPRGLPQPIESKLHSWRFHASTIIGLGLLVGILTLYLSYQIFTLRSGPNLSVITPDDNQVMTTNIVSITGQADLGSSVSVNEQSVRLSSEGQFQTSLNLSPGIHQIQIRAVTRDGKSSDKTLTVTVKPE